MSDVARRAAALAGGTLAGATRLAGGSLSEVQRVDLADGRKLVAKHASTARAEAAMLAAIRATGAPAPAVLGLADDLLVMEAIDAGGRLAGPTWSSLAAVLARLHVPTREAYGWPADHAFGAVALANARTEDWPAFWGAHRIACHAAHVEPRLAGRLERLAARLGDLLPARPPAALLHGDLWGGNVLVGNGRGADGHVAALIDPACYYGDREVDVAMLTVFDAPPVSFFAALELAPGWRARLPIYRLWPLLVHLRLFGGGYRAQVEAMLDRLDAG